jgi:hypothetical protein
MRHCVFATLVVLGLVAGLPFSSRASAETCDPSLTNSIHALERAVNSIAIASADPVATQRNNDDNIRWMHGELELIREACSRGRDVEAAWRLEDVQLRLKTVVQSSPARPFCRVTGRMHGNCPLTADSRGVKRR